MSAIQNYQFAQSLFDPTRQSVGRFLDTQATIAQQAQQLRRQKEMMNLKRLQELEDQATEAGLRTHLANIAVQGQKDVESSRAARDDARFASAMSREDAKATEAERKANIAQVKAAYAKYQAAGGTEKIASFGPEDSPDTFYKIQEALGTRVGENERTQFGTLANLLREREQEIVAITMPTEDEVSALTDQAIQNMALVDGMEDAVKMYNKLAAKLDPATAIDQVSLKYPAFARALKTQVTASVSALRAEKAKSPEFIRNLQGYQAERSAVTKAALESPFGSAFFEGLKTPPAAQKPAPKAADLSNLKVDGGAKAKPQAAATPGPAAFSLPGFWNRRGDAAEFALQTLATPGRLLDTAGRYGGAALRGFATGDYTVPDRGEIANAGVSLGNLIVRDPYAR